MKNIDFTTAFADLVTKEYGFSLEENDGEDFVSSFDTSSYLTKLEWDGHSARSDQSKKGLLSPKKQPPKWKHLIMDENDNKDPTSIKVPAWLNNCIEEIAAFI
eukprot:4207656-Ditylum_brightwellii.AAC.1